jgi:tRNA pseudouridine38-40 synthase
MTDMTQPGGKLQIWKLTLAYDGTDFKGWQVQPGEPTIQGELRAALARVTGEAPLPQGSGRTDAGVHALAQVASFVLGARIPAENLARALNRTLPDSIRILDARIAPDGFHARHSAVAKTYEYRVFLERNSSASSIQRVLAPDFNRSEPEAGTVSGHDFSRAEPQTGLVSGHDFSRAEREGRKGASAPEGRQSAESERPANCSPFLARYVYPCSWPLDLESLQAAAQQFAGEHDFTSFAATDPDQNQRNHDADPGDEPSSAIRTIFSSAWERRNIEEGVLLVYRVRGNGFLHHMVRNLVGTMIDMGRGYCRPEEIPAILAARSRAAAGPTAPARGLFLHSVEYGTAIADLCSRFPKDEMTR